MPSAPNSPAGPPSGKGRPTPREALARAQAAAGPAVARAQAKAGPKVEEAAAKAGTLLGTLRDRAKETARGFTDGYGANEKSSEQDDAASDSQGAPASPAATEQQGSTQRRPRPR
ncbi:MAG: hypothetical protein ACR2LX_15575 [Jatrophihabitans sp.]